MEELKKILEFIVYLIRELSEDFEIGDKFDSCFSTYKGEQFYEYGLRRK